MHKPTYSTKKITPALISEVKEAIKNVSEYGSVEIYVQNSVVTQITIRKIKKTSILSNKDSKKDIS